MLDTDATTQVGAPPSEEGIPLAVIAEGIGLESELLEATRKVAKRPDNVLGLLVRPLAKQEIAIMEARGCRADDWTRVRVAEDFDPFRVRRTHIVGNCVLGRFASDARVMPDVTLPAGIYDCTLINCQIGNDCLLENVRFAANLVVEHQAVLFDVGSITCSGAAVFGCGQSLSLAVEVGGRDLPLWAEVGVSEAAEVVRNRADRAGQQAVAEAVAAYVRTLSSPVAWVRRGAVVRHADCLRDAYIGPGALIDRACAVANVAILSSAEEPTTVQNGATVEDAVLQWGARVSGGAIVRKAALLEHSGVDENAVVSESLIGPNTVIARGEVTSSLVGPFVGFHHQSLLIAAFWPEGKGNVAYGAMVGSNHTGRAPDQEIWPGEGTFFGLGCSIKLPADFSQAPYCFISAGVATLPQRITFPFSVIATPSETLSESLVPRAYNEIQPAWGLFANAYAIERMESKFASRDHAKRQVIQYKVLRPTIMREVRRALAELEGISVPKPVYLQDDLPGLGKNFLREEIRQRAIEAYRRVLKRYGLRILLGEAEGRLTIPGSAEIAHELIDALMPGTGLADRLRDLVAIERENARLVEASKAADDVRGTRIIPGYGDAHVPAAADPVVERARERARSTEERVAQFLATG